MMSLVTKLALLIFLTVVSPLTAKALLCSDLFNSKINDRIYLKLTSIGYSSEVAKKIIQNQPEIAQRIFKNPELGQPVTVYRGVREEVNKYDPTHKAIEEPNSYTIEGHKGIFPIIWTSADVNVALQFTGLVKYDGTPIQNCFILKLQIPRFMALDVKGYRGPQSAWVLFLSKNPVYPQLKNTSVFLESIGIARIEWVPKDQNLEDLPLHLFKWEPASTFD